MGRFSLVGKGKDGGKIKRTVPFNLYKSGRIWSFSTLGDTDALGDPTLLGMFWPRIRDYIKPETARGPDTTKLLTPRILTFTRQ
jgi:hypothetical protein